MITNLFTAHFRHSILAIGLLWYSFCGSMERCTVGVFFYCFESTLHFLYTESYIILLGIKECGLDRRKMEKQGSSILATQRWQMMVTKVCELNQCHVTLTCLTNSPLVFAQNRSLQKLMFFSVAGATITCNSNFNFSGVRLSFDRLLSDVAHPVDAHVKV